MSRPESDPSLREVIGPQESSIVGIAKKSRALLRETISGLKESALHYTKRLKDDVFDSLSTPRLKRFATRGVLGLGVLGVAGGSAVPAAASQEDIFRALSTQFPLSRNLPENNRIGPESTLEAPSFLANLTVTREQWVRNARDIRDIYVSKDQDGNLRALHALDKSPSGNGVRVYRAPIGERLNPISPDLTFQANVVFMEDGKGFIGGETAHTSAIPKLVDLNGNPIQLPEGMRGVVKDITRIEGTSDYFVNVPGFETAGSAVIVKADGKVVRVSWPENQENPFSTNNQVALSKIKNGKVDLYSPSLNFNENRGFIIGSVDINNGQSTAVKKFDEVGELNQIDVVKDANGDIKKIWGVSFGIPSLLSLIDLSQQKVISVNYLNALKSKIPDFAENSLLLTSVVTLGGNMVLAGGSYGVEGAARSNAILTVWEVTNDGKLNLVSHHKVEPERDSFVKEVIRVKSGNETGLLINLSMMGLIYMATDPLGKPTDGTITYLGNGLTGYETTNPQSNRTVHRASLPHVTFQYAVPSRN